MTYTYCMREDTVRGEEGKAYTAYGIDAISSEGKMLLSFSDVFFDRDSAERFAALCNGGNLPLYQLSEAIEDALAQAENAEAAEAAD